MSRICNSKGSVIINKKRSMNSLESEMTFSKLLMIISFLFSTSEFRFGNERKEISDQTLKKKIL